MDILSNPNVANILTLLGEQPLGPPAGSPVSPENAAPQQPNQAGQAEIPALMENPQAQSVAVNANQGPLPTPAQPPAVQGAQGQVEQPTTSAELMKKNIG